MTNSTSEYVSGATEYSYNGYSMLYLTSFEVDPRFDGKRVITSQISRPINVISLYRKCLALSKYPLHTSCTLP